MGPDVRVGILADELPGACVVPAGALDDEPVVGPHDEETPDALAPAGEVNQDRAAVARVGSMDSPLTVITRQCRATRLTVGTR